MVARSGEGIDDLLAEMEAVAKGRVATKPYRLKLDVPGLTDSLDRLVTSLRRRFPGLPHAEWIALRLLEGDRAIAARVADGSIGRLTEDAAENVRQPA